MIGNETQNKKLKNKYKMTVLWVNIFRIACTFCAQNANTEYSGYHNTYHTYALPHTEAETERARY